MRVGCMPANTASCQQCWAWRMRVGCMPANTASCQQCWAWRMRVGCIPGGACLHTMASTQASPANVCACVGGVLSSPPLLALCALGKAPRHPYHYSLAKGDAPLPLLTSQGRRTPTTTH
eukprot:1156227-Pelagomonas_calceolata.AAC.11